MVIARVHKIRLEQQTAARVAPVRLPNTFVRTAGQRCSSSASFGETRRVVLLKSIPLVGWAGVKLVAQEGSLFDN